MVTGSHVSRILIRSIVMIYDCSGALCPIKHNQRMILRQLHQISRRRSRCPAPYEPDTSEISIIRIVYCNGRYEWPRAIPHHHTNYT